ncbi:MAG TPA: hypothetical protein VG455_02450 [Acidimicrobiales bacterium]|nr:hypothetical protein [Acidimicrobiales bacterium]
MIRPTWPQRSGRVGPGRRRLSNSLLLVGYPLAGWAAARLVPMYRDEDRARYLALQAGTACVTAGHLVARRFVAGALNAAALAAFAGVWLTYRRPPS